jgi:predicted nucleic acid-binding protein
MKNSTIVVDANLAVFTVVDTDMSLSAARAWEKLLSDGAELYAPGLWIYETTSVIRKYLALGNILEEEAKEALGILAQMQIQFVPDDLRLRQSALNWAARLRQKTAYDGFYLAAAEQIGAELWTADQALANNARQVGAGWVHWMGEIE